MTRHFRRTPPAQKESVEGPDTLSSIGLRSVVGTSHLATGRGTARRRLRDPPIDDRVRAGASPREGVALYYAGGYGRALLRSHEHRRPWSRPGHETMNTVAL